MEGPRRYSGRGTRERLYPSPRSGQTGGPFGGIYRIIGFYPLQLYQLRHPSYLRPDQYKSLPFIATSSSDGASWLLLMGESSEVIPAQQRSDDQWYQGTADAIYQNFYTLQRKDLMWSSFCQGTTSTKWTIGR